MIEWLKKKKPLGEIMLRSQTNIAINEEDKDKEEKLTSLGITKIAIYRAGMEALRY